MEKDQLRTIEWNKNAGIGDLPDTINGWFHGFYNDLKPFQESSTVELKPVIMALIELEDGSLVKVEYQEIRFTDRITPPYHKRLK